MCHFHTSAWLLSSALCAISKKTVGAVLHIYQSVLEQKKKEKKEFALLPYFIVVSATKKATGQPTTVNQCLIPTFAAGLFQSSSDTMLKWTLRQRK